MDGRYWGHSHRNTQAMSEEQLKAFLEVVKADADLQEKLKGAADLDAAVAIANEAKFEMSKDDWFKYLAEQPFELGDEELELVAGAGQCKATETGKGSFDKAGRFWKDKNCLPD